MTDILKKYVTVDDNHRVFLVVVDDSEEMLVALRFAYTNQKRRCITLFRDIEPSDYHQWASVSDLMQQEARETAEEIERVSQEVVELWLSLPYTYEYRPEEKLIALIDEEPTISFLCSPLPVKMDRNTSARVETLVVSQLQLYLVI